MTSLEFDESTAVEIPIEFDENTAEEVPLEFDESTSIELPTETQTIYDEEKGYTFSAPTVYTGPEIKYLKDRDLDGKSGFVGFVNVGGEGIHNSARGVLALASSMFPTIAGGLLKETGELSKKKLVENSELLGRGFENLRDGELTPDDVFNFVTLPVQVPVHYLEKKLLDFKIPDKVSGLGDKLIKWNQKFIEDNELLLPEEQNTPFNRFMYALGSGFASIGSALGVTVMTGNPGWAAAIFGLFQKTSIYQEAREKGFEPEAASGISNFAGLAEGALEFVGNSLFLKAASEAKGIAKILFQSVEEAIQEGSQQLGEEVITQTTGVRDLDIKGGAGRVAYSAMIGAIMGGGTAAVIDMVTETAQEEGVPVEQAQKIAEKVLEKKDQIEDEALKIVEQEVSPLKKDEQAQSKVAEIIRKFQSGEDIDIEKELGVGAFQQVEDKRALVKEFKQRPEPRPKIALPKDTSLDLEQELTQKKIKSIKQERAIITKKLVKEVESRGFLENATIKKIKDKSIRRNIEKLNKELSRIDETIQQIEREIEIRQKEGRPIIAPRSRIKKLAAQRQPLIKQIGEAVAFNESLEPIQITKEELESFIRNREIKTRTETQKKLEREKIRTVREGLKKFKKGLRIGSMETEQSIQEKQEQLIKLIEQSGIPLDEKGKFLKTLKVKNLRTVADFLKVFPAVQERIETAIERKSRNKAKAKLKSFLKRTKPKKQSGKPVGKFTPEIQDILDRFRKINKLNGESAQTLLDKRLEQDTIPTPIEALENRLLDFKADYRRVSLENLQDLVDNIEALMEEGATLNAVRAFNKQSRLINLREIAAESIIGDENLDLIDETTFKARIKNLVKETRGSLSGMYNGWNDTIDIIMGKSNRAFADEIGSMPNERFQEVKGRANRHSQEILEIAKKSFGIENESQLFNKIQEDHKKETIGIFINKAGKKIRWQMSRAEARKRWMVLQDPSLVESVMHESGDAYTQDMVDALNKFLDPVDKQFAKAQLDWYKGFYKEVNKVYSRIYGVNLPFNEFYSPISRKVSKENPVDSFMQDMGFRRSIAPGSLKDRVKNFRPIREQSDINTALKHIMEMSHFIEFVDTAQELNAIFTDGDVRDSIERKYGKVILDNIDGYLRNFTTGHIERAGAYFNLIDNLRKNFTTAVLGGKVAIGVKQLTSFIAYSDFVTTKEFTEGVLDFIANPQKAIDTLNDSKLLQNRGSTLVNDLAGVARGPAALDFSKGQRFKDLMLLSTKMGDKGAIVLGGWAVYRAAIKNGKSHQEAIKLFDKATSRTQQSSDLDQLSRLQSEGSLRLFTMFMSAPNQYLRREMAAWRHLSRKQISPAQFAKKIGIYHFALPMLFQFIADGFEWDEDNQIRSAILGSFNGAFILADSLNALAYALMDDDASMWQSMKRGIPILQAMNNVIIGVSEIAEFTLEDIISGMKELTEAGGQFTGYPTPQLINAVEGFMQLEEDPKAGTLRILGWPKSGVVRDNKRAKGSRKAIGR